MSLKNVTKTEKNVVEIEFSIDKKAFDEEVSRVFKKNVAKLNVPGFRKGKAPRSIIEKMYGKGVFYDDAINNLLPDAYTEAVKESKAEVVSHPEFEVVSIDDDGVVMKAKVFVKPEVEIKDYKGIEVEKTVKKVTADDIDREIQMVRERNSRMIDITDRAAQNGDNVIIDYEGFADGVAFKGGKGEKHDLKLGSGQFIPGFEDQIIGHNIGDAFDVNVTFPTEYHAESLAGKEATFKVVLHEIKFNELPELNDEFAKNVSKFETFEEYKADVKANLKKQNEEKANRENETNLLTKIIEGATVEIPACMIEKQIDYIVRETEYQLSYMYRGLKFEDYLKYTGMTMEDFRKQNESRATQEVKSPLVFEAIIKAENITVTDEQVDAEVAKMAESAKKTAEEYKKDMDPRQLDYIRNDVLMTNLLSFLKARINGIFSPQ